MSEKIVTIVIPGFLGSTLVDASTGRKYWGGLTVFWGDFSLLALDDNYEKDAVSGLKLEARGPVWPIYKGLLQFLARRGLNPVFYAYDWRRPLKESVSGLQQLLCTKYPDYKVNLVGHSMGGIVAALWHEKFGLEKLNRYIALGTPTYGAEMAITILDEGSEKIARLNARSSAIKLRKLAWGMPAIYELLPPLEGIYERRNWPSELGVRSALLKKARLARAFIDNSLETLGNIPEKIALIAGTGEKTSYWSVDSQGKLNRKDDGIGDGWILSKRAGAWGVKSYFFRKKLKDIFDLQLHYPSIPIYGTHPVLPMFRDVQLATATFLSGGEIKNLEIVP